MSRKLDDLSPRMKPYAVLFLARCVEAGIPIMIVDTRRTAKEHKANLAKGVSWVKRSKHMDGDAIDVAPYFVYALSGPNKLQWDGDDPVWLKLGRIGEAIGLKWGGRWTVRDLGHFEYAEPQTVA